MENQVINTEETTPTTAAAEQAPKAKAVKKASKPRVAKPKAKAAPVATETASQPVETPTEPVAETAEPVKEKSSFQKGIEAGKATRKIVVKAGTKILGSSVQTTQALASIYKKAGKKVIELGKELIEDTTKVVGENQKVVRKTSVKAFNETVETLKESNLLENPLKKIRKSKKK